MKPTKAQVLLAASNLDQRLKLVILLWADTNHTWPRLYRIMEEIEQILGKQINLAGLGSEGQRDRFKRSANTAEVAGKDSRHGSKKFQILKIL